MIQKGWLTLLGLLGCATPDVLPAPPKQPHLLLETATPFALLRWLEPAPAAEPPTLELDRLFEGLVFLSDQTREEVQAGLRVVGAVRLEEARACVEAVVSVLEARSDVIRARVARLIPEEAEPGPPLSVVPVFGLPEGQPLGMVAWDGHRALLIDALALGREAGSRSGAIDRDALGRRLLLAITPELFLLRLERFRESLDGGRNARRVGVGRLFERLLNEGVADFLRMPPEERFDAQGRRSPIHDAIARRTLLRFAENLSELQADGTTEDRRQLLLWSFADGPRSARWGTYAGALMVDAILRFGPPARMPEVLRNGPLDLITAYREICGRHAAVPPLGPSTAALLRDVYATGDGHSQPKVPAVTRP